MTLLSKTLLITVLCLVATISNPIFAGDIEQQVLSIKDYEDKELAISELKEILKRPKLTPEESVLTLNTLVWSYVEFSKLDKGLETITLALTLAQKYGLTKSEADAYKLKGTIHLTKGEYINAINSYEAALYLYKQQNNYLQQGNIHNNIGIVHSVEGKRQQALARLLMAKKLYEEFGSQQDIIDITFNIAMQYFGFKRYPEALTLLKETFNLIEEDLPNHINKKSQNDLLYMIKQHTAIIYSAQGRYLAAESILQELSTSPSEDKKFLPIIKANLGSVSLKLGKIDASIKYANECIEFSKEDAHSMANCQLLLAKSYFALGNIKESLEHLTASNEISSSKGYESMRNDSLHLSSLILARKGQTQDAMKASITFRVNEKKRHSLTYQDLFNETVNLLQQTEKTEEAKERIQQLSQNKKVLQLEMKQLNTLYSSIAIITLIFSIALFFMYKRNEDRKSNLLLEQEVKLRTKDLNKAKDELFKLSFLDGLTSVYNRRSFDADLEKLWHKSQKGEGEFLLLLADVDHFKRYNDEYGHVAGDDALVQITKVMNEYTRNEDRVYRYGGEEFAILFTNHNNYSTTEIMDRIIQEIEQLKIPHKQSEHGVVTISAGVCGSNEKAASIDKVMTLADERLYLAKNKGRNCLVYNLAI